MIITVTFGSLAHASSRAPTTFNINIMSGNTRASMAKNYRVNSELFGFDPQEVAAFPGDPTIPVKVLRRLVEAGMVIDPVELGRKDRLGMYEEYFYLLDGSRTRMVDIHDVNQVFAVDEDGRVGISPAGYVVVLMFLAGYNPSQSWRVFEWCFIEPLPDFTEFAAKQDLGGAFI